MRPAVGLFAALLNEELVRENSTMRNYKTAVVGTGECEIIWATKNNSDFMRVCAA